MTLKKMISYLPRHLGPERGLVCSGPLVNNVICQLANPVDQQVTVFDLFVNNAYF